MPRQLDPPTAVPTDETPAARCPYCDRPFDAERLCDFHVGERHAAEATTAELDAHEDAIETERDELFFYHLKVVVALGVIYSALVILYMAALGSGFL